MATCGEVAVSCSLKSRRLRSRTLSAWKNPGLTMFQSVGATSRRALSRGAPRTPPRAVTEPARPPHITKAHAVAVERQVDGQHRGPRARKRGGAFDEIACEALTLRIVVAGEREVERDDVHVGLIEPGLYRGGVTQRTQEKSSRDDEQQRERNLRDDERVPESQP